MKIYRYANVKQTGSVIVFPRIMICRRAAVHQLELARKPNGLIDESGFDGSQRSNLALLHSRPRRTNSKPVESIDANMKNTTEYLMGGSFCF
ncbi:MAG: hypothetical protein OJF50_004265 [Nitrospira sp.]|nr:hypothetical protein [Nitrospira sp.]